MSGTRIDMGDGVVVRHATIDDLEQVVALNGRMFCKTDEDEPSEGIMKWTRSLMDGHHPTARAEHFTVAEDTGTGRIVSACGYIPQRWTFGCADLGEPVVEFPVGRPEIVETHRDYRRRGLVRVQFDLLHNAGAERGEMLQFIDGIHAYYRQFGYEYAIERFPMRQGQFHAVRDAEGGAAEPFQIRAAVANDADFVQNMYQQSMWRSLVAAIHTEDMFRHYLGESERPQHAEGAIIERSNGTPVGVVLYKSGNPLEISLAELAPGASWLEAYRPVLRWLKQRYPDHHTFIGMLQPDHPLYVAASNAFTTNVPNVHPAWYVRVPDVPAFLRMIAPVLEHRLEKSAASGHSGEVKISFYRNGVRIVLDRGAITEIEPWRPSVEDGGNCGFVDLTFLQTLFGYRSLEELHYLHPDSHAWEHDAEVLVGILFPKRSSGLWPVG